MLALIKKDLRVLCASPLLAITAALFLFLTGIAFTADVTQASPLRLPEASIRGMIYFMSMILLFLGPFLSMRSLAEEKKTGTIELLRTSPITVRQIVLAKYLSLLMILVVLLLLTIVYPLFLAWCGQPDLLPMLLAYLGLFLFGASLLAIGLFMSSWTRSQMLAAILTFVTTITLWFLSEVGGQIGAKFSLIEHLHSFALGIFDLPDLTYYLLIVILFLFLTMMVLRNEGPKFGTKTIVITVAVVASCILLFTFLDRYPVRRDLTQEGEFSLSPQTKESLRGLAEDITVTALFGRGEDLDDVFAKRRVDDILREYARRSPRIRYRMIDPDAEPAAAVQYKITNDGTIIFQVGAQRKEIYKSQLFDYRDTPKDSLPTFVGEGLFTNALLKISRRGQSTICLLQGHGDRSLDDTSSQGLRQFREYLEKNNYEVKAVSLATSGGIPSNCSLLILAASARMAQATSDEDRVIRGWTQKGGKILLLLEPAAGDVLPETLKFLHVQAHTNLVIDLERHFVLGPHFPAPVLSDHPITGGLKALNPILSTARSLSYDEREGSLAHQALLTTSDAAWGESDLTGSEPHFDKEQDSPGPLTLGLAVDRKETGRPVAVIVGDADFLSNSLIQAPGNLDLSLNMVGWLAGDKEQVTIRPKTQRFRNLTLTEGRARFIALFTQFVYPLGILVVGGLYWFRRRKK